VLAETLPAFERGEISPVPQGDSPTPHTRKLKKEDGLLSLDAPAEENWNKYRAFADSIGTFYFKNEKRVKITKASRTGNSFVIERVIPEGKREMSYADFARLS
jgi:methionyl-tRNA formyltransferase